MVPNRFDILLNHLQGLKKVAVAFSGGVDSTLLLKAAQMALGNNVLAISIRTMYIPGWELEEAVNFSRQHGIRHKIFEMPFLHQIRNNPKNRCYWCKSNLFKYMQSEAQKEGFNTVIDGTNFDDLKDYRPGLQALKELNIQSPLLELKITKDEIREFSRNLNLPTANKPAYACLLTRFPYDEEIHNSDLRRVEKAEKYLRTLGFQGSRVRVHGTLARVEIPRHDLNSILNADLFHKVSRELSEIGFTYVTLDMEGYRTGSHNESL
ncbi:MAG: ATP-dependent sacrificial sulfur transferase LarE [Bacteroidota bacterium]|nr:ATP-dependent sacrificial sulfur transferase LarE [Bacteroidota bacterium]